MKEQVKKIYLKVKEKPGELMQQGGGGLILFYYLDKLPYRNELGEITSSGEFGSLRLNLIGLGAIAIGAIMNRYDNRIGALKNEVSELSLIVKSLDNENP